MQIDIDYASFSIPGKPLLKRDKSGRFKALKAPDNERDAMTINYLLLERNWQPGAHFAPFSEGIHSKELGCTYMYNPRLPYSLIQFTGAGCQILRDQNALEGFLRYWQQRCTRIDIACDMETDVLPVTFCVDRIPGRFKATHSIESQTGQTVYIGAPTGGRHAKCYRYYDPHPRQHLLRVEFTQKGELAQAAVGAILEDGLQAVAVALGSAYGWMHPAWQPGKTPTTIELTAPKTRGNAGRERWLFKQVLPAIQAEIDDGGRDMVKILVQEILKKLGEA